LLTTNLTTMKIEQNILLELSDSSSDAFQVCLENGQLVYLNSEASQRLGIPRDKVSDYYVPDFEKIFGERNSIQWQAHVQELKQKKTLEIEGSNLNISTGERFPVEVKVKYEKINGVGYIIASSRDVSDRVKLYSEIANQQNTITTLYHTFQRFMTSDNYHIEADLGLDKVVDFLNFDSFSIYFYHPKLNEFKMDYQYTRYEEHFPDINLPSEVSFDEFFGVYDKIKSGEPILIESQDPSIKRKSFSISPRYICYYLPLIDGNKFLGFVRLDEAINLDGSYNSKLEKYKNYSRIISSSMSLQRRNIELNKNSKIFKNLYESLEDVFFIFDIQKKQYKFMSPACKQVFGKDQEFFYSKDLYNDDYVLEEYRMLFDNGCRILRENDFTSFEYKIMHPSGKVKHIFKKMYPIRNKRGELIQITGICMDITEKKNNEEKIKESNMIIHSNNILLEEKNKKIEELLRQQETDLYLKTIKLSNINSVLNKTKSELDSLLLEYGNKGNQYVKKIKKNIDEILNSGNNNWQEIQIEFEKIRPHFFKSLSVSFPSLTPNDLKHCYYIVTGLSSSEVSELISLTIRSVETSRYRIKRKLKLPREVSLFDFLNRY